MEELELKINAWLREHLIPRLAVIFHEKYNLVDDVEYKVARPRGTFYLSDLFFVTIRFPSSEGGSGEKSLVIKMLPQDCHARDRQNYNDMFDNEILFYQRFANRSSDYPLCYLCDNDPVCDKIMVLENVCPRGYFPCPSKINLPFDYLLAGLQTLGRFHGQTYTLKEQNPTKFHRIANDIIKVRYGRVDKYSESFACNIQTRISRVIRNLQSRTSCDPIFVAKVTRLFEDCYVNVMLRSVKPREPLATIVHGDSTVNNILYRKRTARDEDEVEDDRRKQYKGMLVDFALIMYSSPATDVSTFLYISASRHDVNGRFQELFKAYHDALTECLKDHKVWDSTKYSYDLFLQDYKRSGIFGYVISTFFLPIMTEYAKDNSLLDNYDELVEQLNITGGGVSLSNQLVDMLIDAHEAGLLDYYVNNQSD